MFNMLQKKMFIYPWIWGCGAAVSKKNCGVCGVDLFRPSSCPATLAVTWRWSGASRTGWWGSRQCWCTSATNGPLKQQIRGAHWDHDWLVVDLPPEKWWSESQLGWWHSQYMESHKIPWFQSPPTRWGYHWFCGEKNMGWWSGRS